MSRTEARPLRASRVEAQGPPLALLATPGLSREARAGIENLLPGRVEAHDAEGGVTRVRLAGGLGVSVALAPEAVVGSAVLLAILSAARQQVSRRMVRHRSSRRRT